MLNVCGLKVGTYLGQRITYGQFIAYIALILSNLATDSYRNEYMMPIHQQNIVLLESVQLLAQIWVSISDFYVVISTFTISFLVFISPNEKIVYGLGAGVNFTDQQWQFLW